jgi:hypothetical protein
MTYLLSGQSSTGYWTNNSVIEAYLATLEDQVVENEVKGMIKD